LPPPLQTDEDVAIYDVRNADLAAGRDEPLPDPVSAALDIPPVWLMASCRAD